MRAPVNAAAPQRGGAPPAPHAGRRGGLPAGRRAASSSIVPHAMRPAAQAGVPPDAPAGPAPVPETAPAWDESWADGDAGWTSGVDVVYVADGDDDEELDDDAADAKPVSKRLPAEMRCFDTARIYVKGGDGGKGIVAFRREKFVPKGGPAGGDGGDGGHVFAVADESLTSLASFRRAIHFRALPGGSGGGAKCHGANAGHVEVKVPLGTIFRERGAPEGAPPLAELVAHGERALLAAGGRGGKGNAAFKTHANNAPTMAELGEPGEERWVDVELRVVADVGIVGVPNAGKSTLLSVLSAAKPKIADYPFTTLVPNLGVCELDFRTTVFADVPGLLEGAHAGVGLGHEFLRHVSRCRAVVHVIDGSRRDPVGDYAALRNELALFSPELEALPQVVAYNKCDVPDSADYYPDVLAHLVGTGVAPEDVIAVSAVTGDGVTALVRRVRAVLDALPQRDCIPRHTDAVNLTAPVRVPAGVRDYEIAFDGAIRAWTVTGPSLDRFVSQTDWNYYESALRFQKVLEASGIAKSLRLKGVKEGDAVRVGGAEFAWSDDRSDGALYDAWMAARKASGRVLQGGSRWPHGGG